MSKAKGAGVTAIIWLVDSSYTNPNSSLLHISSTDKPTQKNTSHSYSRGAKKA
jgi:hypothetical protein